MVDKTDINAAILAAHPEEENIEELSEIGNAERFVRLIGENFLYVPEAKCWFAYKDGRWVEDMDNLITLHESSDAVIKDVKKLMGPSMTALSELMKKEGASNKQSDVGKAVAKVKGELGEINKHYKMTQSRRGIDAAMFLARKLPGMKESYEQFDSKGHFLGVKNGVVDLRSGVLIQNDRKFLVTKTANVEYDKNAKCPEWESYLNLVMEGDKDRVSYLQVLLGSCLVGNNADRFNFFYGESGANGKSTVVDTVIDILGDYGAIGDPETLTKSTGNDKGYHLASFKGARMVVYNESEEKDVNLAGSIIKKTVNSGQVAARHPAGRPFSYQPLFTPIFCCNHLPSISIDPSLWRRVVIVPWNYEVPLNERDKDFGKKMLKKERTGIFNWLILGACIYLMDGLVVPASILANTEAEKDEQDMVKQFMAAMSVPDENSKIKITDFRHSYLLWCKDQGLTRQDGVKKVINQLKGLGGDIRKGTGNVNYLFGHKIGTVIEIPGIGVKTTLPTMGVVDGKGGES